jgi:hypothetical protein
MAAKKIPQMTLAEIEQDIIFFQELIERAKSLKEAGYYEKKGIEAETVYCGNAMEYAGLGMAYALHGDWDLAKEAFQTLTTQIFSVMLSLKEGKRLVSLIVSILPWPLAI